MQKLLMILICMFIGSAHATEMCAKNDTVVIPLDATVKGDGTGFNAIEWIWWAGFPYGKIYGSVACLSLQEVQEIQNDPNLSTGASVLNSDSEELIGRMMQDPRGNERIFCYYKLLHPMASSWVLKGNYGAANECQSRCIDHVARGMGDASIVTRSLMFNSIGASMAE